MSALSSNNRFSIPATPAPTKAPRAGMSNKKWLWVGLAAFWLIVVAALGYLYINAKHDADRLANPSEAAKQEADALKEKVGMLIQLPSEQPTIATVNDVSKLKGQAFFKNAQNGDKVLIFTGAKEAILYRPSTNKIINVAPVNIGNNSSSSSSQSNTNNTTNTTSNTTNTTP